MSPFPSSSFGYFSWPWNLGAHRWVLGSSWPALGSRPVPGEHAWNHRVISSGLDAHKTQGTGCRGEAEADHAAGTLEDVSAEGKCACRVCLRGRLETPEVARRPGSCRSFPGRGGSAVWGGSPCWRLAGTERSLAVTWPGSWAPSLWWSTSCSPGRPGEPEYQAAPCGPASTWLFRRWFTPGDWVGVSRTLGPAWCDLHTLPPVLLTVPLGGSQYIPHLAEGGSSGSEKARKASGVTPPWEAKSRYTQFHQVPKVCSFRPTRCHRKQVATPVPVLQVLGDTLGYSRDSAQLVPDTQRRYVNIAGRRSILGMPTGTNMSSVSWETWTAPSRLLGMCCPNVCGT